MSKNKILLIVVIIIIILIGAFYIYKKPSNQPITENTQVNTPVDDQSDNSVALETINNQAIAVAPEEIQSASEVKEFNVSGANFSFSLKEIKVKRGDKVKIVFTNNEGFHDLIIDEFKVNTGQIKASETKTVEFTADKTGIFEYYCSVGQHRANGMFGQLIVE